MKLAKKIMVAAIAVAALGLVGCQTNIAPEGFIKGTTYGAKVEYTNEGADTIRNLHRTNAKHSGGIWTITQNVNFNANGGEFIDSGDGLMGVIFNLEKTAEGKYNFFVFGSGANKNTDLTYLSYFVNISEDELNSKNFGVSSANVVATVSGSVATMKTKTVASEWEILKLSRDIMNNVSTAVYSSDKKTYSYKVVVSPTMTSTDKTTAKYDGGINVNVYRTSENLELDKAGQLTTTPTTTIFSQKIANVFTTAELAEANTVPSSSDVKDGYTKVSPTKFPQNYIGYYGNIYPGKTLTGKWELGNGSRNQFNAAEEE